MEYFLNSTGYMNEKTSVFRDTIFSSGIAAQSTKGGGVWQSYLLINVLDSYMSNSC